MFIHRLPKLDKHRHYCVTSKHKDLYGKKTYRFRNLRKWKDFNKKQLTLHKTCVTSLLCGQWADLWPFYGLFCKLFSLYIKVFIERNPYIFVGYGNDRFFSIQIHIFRILRNNSDVRRRLYFELRLPVVRPSSSVEFHRNESQMTTLKATFDPFVGTLTTTNLASYGSPQWLRIFSTILAQKYKIWRLKLPKWTK